MSPLSAGIDGPAIGALIGSGKVADVHAYGTAVIKLLKPGRPRADAFIEAAMLAMVEAHGLPAPRVHAVGEIEGRWGLVMDRVEGTPLARLALSDPTRVAECLREMVRLQCMLHATTETRLRGLKTRLAANIARAGGLSDGDRQRLGDRLAELPDGNRLCHGDLHPFNIIGEPGQGIVIDWMDTTSGPPEADACRSYLLLRAGAPDLAEPYLAAYCGAAGIDPAGVIAWLPVTAAARLCEDVPEEQEALLALARNF